MNHIVDGEWNLLSGVLPTASGNFLDFIYWKHLRHAFYKVYVVEESELERQGTEKPGEKVKVQNV